MAPPKNMELPQSDVPGVSYVKNTGQWQVQFTRQGRHYGKRFKTQEEAERAQPAFLASLPAMAGPALASR